MEQQKQNRSFAEIIESNKPTLVDFFAEWCGPCKLMKPILQELKDMVGEKATIIKIDVDKNPGISNQYHIRGVPALLLFKDGKVVWQQSGVVPARQLAAVINQHLIQ